MLTLDGDVAVDPVDHAAMMASIDTGPEMVWVAPVRLWPVSTHLSGWVWGHGPNRRYSRTDTSTPDVFTFSYTYLPRALLTACIDEGLEGWCYPGVDKRVSEVARKFEVPIRVCRGASPKHLNFLRDRRRDAEDPLRGARARHRRGRGGGRGLERELDRVRPRRGGGAVGGGGVRPEASAVPRARPTRTTARTSGTGRGPGPSTVTCRVTISGATVTQNPGHFT